MAQPAVLPHAAIAEFCRRWRIVEFAVFGSALRPDFKDSSDIDVLVRLAPESGHTLFDMVRMQDELEVMLGRKVDLVSRKGIEASRNEIRREEILSSAQVLYAA